jgi:hypothetical protein
MKYTKPQLLNTRAASAAIMGSKNINSVDNPNESGAAYRSDE